MAIHDQAGGQCGVAHVFLQGGYFHHGIEVPPPEDNAGTRRGRAQFQVHVLTGV